MPSPEQLFAQFRATGEAGPLGELFDRGSPQLLALALHLCGNPADAEDALQATFVTAIGRRTEWDGVRPVLPWLCGILTLHVKKIGGRRARRRETELPELVLDDGSPLDASERRELVGKLRHHVDRLPVEQRQVLLLQLEHGLAPAEVGEVLGVAPGTVRMRLHRGIAALRGLMPAGLFTLLLGALPSRGVAAVRAAVVAHAARAAGGALLLKTIAALCAALVVLALGWSFSMGGIARTAPLPAEPPVLASSEGGGGAVDDTNDPAARGASERVALVLPSGAPPAAAEPTGTLVVRTLDPATRAALPHTPIEVTAVRGDTDSRFDAWSSASDRDGRSVIAGLPAGTYRAGSGQHFTVTAVAAGATTIVDVELPGRSVPLVRGCVRLANGAPAAHATLVAALQHTRAGGVVGTADGNGRFELPVARGLVMLGARLEGHAPSPLELVPWRPDADLTLVLPSLGAAVRGLVVDEAGAPVGDAGVEIGELRRRRWYDADHVLATPPGQRLRTAADGSFHATDLPAEQVSVFVRADGFAPFHRFVVPRAGDTTHVRCELSPGVPVRGRVLDQHAQPVAAVYVLLGGTSGEQRVTDAQGRFGFRHAARGLQQLEVSGDTIDKRFCERTAADAAEWLVVVSRLAAYPLRLVDEQGRPLQAWTVRAVSSCERKATTDADGRAVLHTGGDGPPSLWLAPEEGLDAVTPWPWPAHAVPGVETTIVVPAAKQPCAVLAGVVHTAAGAPADALRLSLRGLDGKYIAGATFDGAAFRVASLPAGDFELIVGGDVGLRVAVPALRHGEVRDLGTLVLPPMGAVLARVVRPDGAPVLDPGLFLFDAAGHEMPVQAGESPQQVPAGRYTWRVLANDALWQRGTIDVRAGETTPLDVTLQPGVRRYLMFPVPRPDWGEPKRVDYVVRAPDGSEYDRGDFDPREDLPFRYMPALASGAWRLELTLDDGRRFDGTFTLESMAPSLEPIQVAVQPAR